MSGTVSLPDGMYDTPGLTGGERSRLNVARLDSLRLLDVLRAPSTQIITDIRWLQAAGLTIEREFQTAWHTGQAGSILASDPVIIVGSQTGGVWVVNHYPQAIPIVGSHPATPLSNEWDDPDVICLAYAPGVTHQFYAGTIGGHIFLVELQPVLGGMEPKRSTAIPFWGGQILQIIVLEGLRRIVTAGYGGVWWSDIPSLPSDASGYSWHQVGPGGTFSGLAEGPGQSVIVSAWGHDDTMSTHGIFRGQWQGQDLVFSRSPISGADETKMMKTSLTSCAGNRSVLYCSAAALDESILAILTSQNGGASWTTVNAPGPGLSGFQGTHNNVIAVSPFRSNVVALGWRTGGPFISIDSGLSWSHPHSDLDNVHLHSDHQALCFNRNTPDEDWVFAGSDGGVVYTRDGGQTYVSQYSKQLHILQVYANTLAASSRFPGLIAVGTQDNGNIFSNTREEAARWHTLEGGDGGVNRFVDDIGAILHFNNDGAGVKIHFWNATAESFTGGGAVPVIGEAGDLQTPLIEVVTSPSWKRDGKLMYAVAASMGAGRVYGFFANPDGSGAVFQLLADVGAGIGSLASRNGSTVLVGISSSGRILSLSAATGVATDFTVPAEFQSGSVIRLADLAPTRAFALINGILLRYDGAAWKQTSYFGLQMFEADPEPGSGRIFAATDSAVYLSLDDGATWSSASLGLPARPHCTDLRIASDGAGGHDLFLATYGRSVWKAKVDFTPKGPDFQHVPQLVGEALFGILGDGGGAFRVGGQIIWIPPREPLRNILAAIAIDELARSMTSNLGRNIRITAMETIRQIAEAQVRELERGP